jgi:beta-glucanase (GH16 family)
MMTVLLIGALVAAALTSLSALPAANASGTSARTAAAAAPYCGLKVYRKPNGTAWKCTFGDDFNGTTLNRSRWSVLTSNEFSFGKRPDCFVNSPRNVSVGNGVLTLTSRKEPSMFNCKRSGQTFRTQYSAGMVSTYEKFTQAYGRFEFRAKFPYTKQNGVQTSLWLWPAGASGTTWPVSGEMDVAEWYSHFPDRVVPYLHYASLMPSQATNNNCLVNRVQDWHTYLLEWSPERIVISFDGRVCLDHQGGGAPFNKNYMISMFQGFGLKRNAPTTTTPTVSRAQIAWVRVWK